MTALLAYLAHSVDEEYAKEMWPDGPGRGEDYHWDKIPFKCAIEWENGKTNEESRGKIVYIPQNHLFEISEQPNKIKEKIEPVLFTKLPDFKTKYIQAENNIKKHNQQISLKVDDWFTLSDTVGSLGDNLRDLGDKKSIEEEKKKVESRIENIKKKYKLSARDLQNYQKISAKISVYETRFDQIEIALSEISDISEENQYFNELTFDLSPTLENLPKTLQENINKKLHNHEKTLLKKVNKLVFDFRKSIIEESGQIEIAIADIKTKNERLIKNHQKNTELEALVKNLNEKIAAIKEIDNLNKEKKKTQRTLKECEKDIKTQIDQRMALIEQLETSLGDADQSMIEGIKFGLEYNFGQNLELATQKVNAKKKSKYIKKGGSLNILKVRENPAKFLEAVYSGNQKINAGNFKKGVSQEVLSLTEEKLFTAEMEEDKIGGFSESTMTPGKRALFALRLILDESNNQWPLLIDQPEDDLDSRSIFNDIVPFLKKKKKERQIIMVSHDANLVIGSDSEQIIIANRTGGDRVNTDGKHFNYLHGSMEHAKEKDKKCKDTLGAQGIREHACEILDGGQVAFENRRNKYNLKK